MLSSLGFFVATARSTGAGWSVIPRHCRQFCQRKNISYEKKGPVRYKSKTMSTSPNVLRADHRARRETALAGLETPAVVIDRPILEANIAMGAAFARQHKVSLRPHIKTHKSPAIAKLQLAAGAAGTVTGRTPMMPLTNNPAKIAMYRSFTTAPSTLRPDGAANGADVVQILVQRISPAKDANEPSCRSFRRGIMNDVPFLGTSADVCAPIRVPSCYRDGTCGLRRLCGVKVA